MTVIVAQQPFMVGQDFCTTQVSTGATGLSDATPLSGQQLCSIQISSDWTDSALTFQGTLDGVNYYNVYTSTGGEVTYGSTAAGGNQSRVLIFDPWFWSGFRGIKIRSGTAAAPVAQAAVRNVVLGLARLNQLP